MTSPLASSPPINWLSQLENSRCGRVKSLSFHPTRPWILLSLHSGSLQVWDYRLGIRVESFDQKLSPSSEPGNPSGFTGPVRSVVFHPSQPLFASASDDHKVRLWNYKTRKCTHTFQGHIDYVRSVAFHQDLPWIITASDDQTVRIWNWQSRSCIAILTGHTHYVMCAAFHPSPQQPLIVTCSLDQTVRLWDYSVLKAKNSASFSTSSSNAQAEGYCSPFDVQVKHVLEGHDRGVNWVSFHPSKPLIVSCSDDRLVKVWRYNDSRAWELDTFRGHSNNVSSVVFHPTKDWIISNSEDKTLRIWDMSSQKGGSGSSGGAIWIQRREGDRFWSLAVHPSASLIACGHDSGFCVFKLQKERPPFASSIGHAFWVKDSATLRQISFDQTAKASSNHQIPKECTLFPIPKGTGKIIASIAVSKDSKYLLINWSNSNCEFACFPSSTSSSKQPAFKELPMARGTFLSDSRLICWESGAASFLLCDLQNGDSADVLDEFGLNDLEVKNLFSLGNDAVLLEVAGGKLARFDLITRSLTCTADLSSHGPLRMVSLSEDGFFVALAFRKSIIILNSSNLQQVQSGSLNESCPIKSMLWNNEGILIYSTSQHIKFLMINGESGILCSFSSQPEYILAVAKGKVYTLNRQAMLCIHEFQQSELDLKLALEKRDFPTLLRTIKSCNLIGQSIIGYLRRKGYPQIALAFVKDAPSRFELALECGNLEVAFQVAQKLNSPSIWNTLADHAMKLGDFSIAEQALQASSNPPKLESLLMLYCLIGDAQKMKKLRDLAFSIGQESVHFLAAAYLVAEEGAQSGAESKSLPPPLAFLAAKRRGIVKSGGDNDQSANIEDLSIDDYHPSKSSSSRKWNLNDKKWTFSSSSQAEEETNLSQLIAALAEEEEEEEFFDNQRTNNPQSSDHSNNFQSFDHSNSINNDNHDHLSLEKNNLNYNDQSSDEEKTFPNHHSPSFIENEAGWDDLVIDHRGGEAYSHSTNLTQLIEEGASEDEISSFLSEQFGVVNPQPFLQLLQQRQNSLPSFSQVNEQLSEAFSLTTQGKFREAKSSFKRSLILAFLSQFKESSETPSKRTRDLIRTCSNYILGLSMEIARKEPGTSPERNLRLAVLFARLPLNHEHSILALRSATSLAFKSSQWTLCLELCDRLLKMAPEETVALQTRKIQSSCRAKASSGESSLGANDLAVGLNDDHDIQAISSVNYESVWNGGGGNRIAECSGCGAVAESEFVGTLCRICEIFNYE